MYIKDYAMLKHKSMKRMELLQININDRLDYI